MSRFKLIENTRRAIESAYVQQGTRLFWAAQFVTPSLAKDELEALSALSLLAQEGMLDECWDVSLPCLHKEDGWNWYGSPQQFLQQYGDVGEIECVECRASGADKFVYQLEELHYKVSFELTEDAVESFSEKLGQAGESALADKKKLLW